MTMKRKIGVTVMLEPHFKKLLEEVATSDDRPLTKVIERALKEKYSEKSDQKPEQVAA